MTARFSGSLGLICLPSPNWSRCASVGFRGFLVNRMKPVDISEKWKTPESRLSRNVLAKLSKVNIESGKIPRSWQKQDEYESKLCVSVEVRRFYTGQGRSFYSISYDRDDKLSGFVATL